VFLAISLSLVALSPAGAEKLVRCERVCQPAIRRCVEQTGIRHRECRRLLVPECRRVGRAACDEAYPAPPGTTTTPCADRSGPVVNLTGTYPSGYRATTLAPHMIVDAQGATFVSKPGVMPLYLAGGTDLCIGGGMVRGNYPRRASWSYMHGNCCNTAGLEVKAPRPTVEDLRIDNVEDGIRVRSPADGFVVRGVHLSHIFDDAIDDHECLSGTVEDVLSDGSYVGISSRPNAGQDGNGKVLTIRNSLFRLETTKHPYPRETPPAHGALFKWSDQSVQLVLHDNVFVVVRSHSALGIPNSAHIVSCANNQLVWLGAGPYPGNVGNDPTTGRPCLHVTTDRAVWDDAVAAWQARHPRL